MHWGALAAFWHPWDIPGTKNGGILGTLQGQYGDKLMSQRRKKAHSVSVGLFCNSLIYLILFGRGERIRTSDPLLPKQMRYQTALRPDEARHSTG